MSDENYSQLLLKDRILIADKKKREYFLILLAVGGTDEPAGYRFVLRQRDRGEQLIEPANG